MENFATMIKTAFALIGALLGGWLGGMDGLLYALLSFIVIDYITGVIGAIIKKQLSSEIGARGIAKKIGILLIVGIANIIDTKLVGSGSTMRTACIFFYLANEGISLTENLATIGLPIPQKIVDVLEQLKNKEDNDD